MPKKPVKKTKWNSPTPSKMSEADKKSLRDKISRPSIAAFLEEKDKDFAKLSLQSAGLAHGCFSPAKLKARERELVALEMRKGGYTYPKIGRVLGVTPEAAYYAVKRLMDRVYEKDAGLVADVRKLEIERCDEMLNAVWSRCKMGDGRAIQTAMQIADRRAKLLGLDVPTGVKISGEGEGGAILVESFRKMVLEAQPGAETPGAQQLVETNDDADTDVMTIASVRGETNGKSKNGKSK